ncbi:MAG: hypothetical protein AAFV53_01890 [Myxococcota bacterium]
MVFLMLAACAYDALVTDGIPQRNTLTGSVIASGIDDVAPTMLLLFAADDPPPPTGTGAPEGTAFSTVAPRSFDGGDGLMQAPFILSEIPDGDWIVSALMDTDRDFHPLYSTNAGATCGDYIGQYVRALDDLSPGVVSVSGGERVEGLSVLVAQPIPLERPAFTFDVLTVDQTDPLPQFTVSATGIQSELLTLNNPGEECGVIFSTRFLDEDLDGDPDPHPVYGATNPQAFAAWPKVFLAYIGDDLEAGESYATEAILSPTLFDPEIGFAPMPLTQLEIVFVPVASHVLPDGSEELVQAPDLPTGRWSVTLVLETGQTWTLPNELPNFAAQDGSSFDPIPQGYALNLE